MHKRGRFRCRRPPWQDSVPGRQVPVPVLPWRLYQLCRLYLLFRLCRLLQQYRLYLLFRQLQLYRQCRPCLSILPDLILSVYLYQKMCRYSNLSLYSFVRLCRSADLSPARTVFPRQYPFLCFPAVLCNSRMIPRHLQHCVHRFLRKHPCRSRRSELPPALPCRRL